MTSHVWKVRFPRTRFYLQSGGNWCSRREHLTKLLATTLLELATLLCCLAIAIIYLLLTMTGSAMWPVVWRAVHDLRADTHVNLTWFLGSYSGS